MIDEESDTDDRALIRAILRSRSERAFRLLYRRHAPSLFAFARHVTDTSVDAQELTQDTWIRAVERLDTFRGESAFRSWLFGIAVNCQRNATRKANRRPLVPLDDNDDHDAGHGVLRTRSNSEAIDERIDVADAVRMLSPGYRQVLILHDIHGYTHAEIAEILGIETGSSKSQLHRARKSIRRILT